MHQNPLIRLVERDQLDALIGAFVDDCRLANLSPQTIRFYDSNLRRFRWWCAESGIPLDPTLHSAGQLRDFLRYVQSRDVRWGEPRHGMASRPASDKTLAAYHRVLRRFFNWLVEQEYLERSPMDKIRAPKTRDEQPDPFSGDDLQRLTAVLEARPKSFLADRDRAIVAVLLDVGLRASELCALRVQDVDGTSGRVWVEAGKGNKPRELWLGASARRPVRRYWLRHRQYIDLKLPFFLNGDDHAALHADGLRDITVRLGTAAGVAPCNPHRFRHSFAVSAIRAGMNLFEVQAMLGHTSLEMTKRYAKIAGQDLQLASQQHSALDRLGLKL